MMAYHFQLYIRFIWILTGILFTGILHSQSKDDAAFYAIWSDTTKPETERIDAYFDRLNDMRVFEGEGKVDDKWFMGSGEAIQLAMELNKKEYLPLFYLASAYNYAIILNDFETGCIEANKVVESAKIANASKFPVFTAYQL